jgi:tetratricopeptide (TPR) repeat protein
MNNKKIEEALDLMEQGWNKREDLEFEKAEELLNKAYKIFHSEGDWFNSTEALNHMAYNDKLKAVKLLNKGLETAYSALSVSKEKSVKDELIYRAIISILSSLSRYEEALVYAKKILDRYESPASKADILSFIAMCELRTGNIEKAENTINESLMLLDEGWNDEREPHRSIWKCKILLTYGYILFNKDQKEKAMECGRQAHDLANSYALKTRAEEAHAFLKLFELS